MTSQRSLLALAKQSSLYGISGLLGSAATIVLVPLLTRVLTPLEYGQLELMTVALGQFGLIIQFGIGSALFKVVLAEGADQQRQRQLIGTAHLAVLGAASSAAILLIPFSAALADTLLGDTQRSPLVILGLVKIVGDAAGVVPMANLRIQQRPLLYGLVSAGRLGLTVAFILALWAAGNERLMAVFFALAAESVVYAVVTGILVRGELRFAASVPALRTMLQFGLPLVPYGIGLSLLALGDRYVLVLFADAGAVGVYAVGYKLSAVLAVPVRAFQVAWPAVMFRHAKPDADRAFFAQTLTYLIALLAFMGVSLATFAPEVLKVFAGDRFRDAVVVVPILIFAHIGLGAFYATAVGTNITGKTQYQLYAVSLALVVFAVVSTLLVPRAGAVGAALATASGYITLAVVGCAFSVRLYPVPYTPLRLTALMGTTVALCGIAQALGPVEDWQSLGAKVSVPLAFPILLLVFGIVRRSDVGDLITAVAYRFDLKRRVNG